jgi:N-acetylglucosaminyldiphosphoundecaprenol N-acetyl-beta-D-mannosaminyltransferase
MMLAKRELLGIKVTGCGYEEIEAYLLGALAQPGEPGKVIEVMTLSFPMLGVYEKQPAYRQAIDHSAVVLPDGIMLVWLSRLFKGGIERRLAGPDFFRRFSEAAHREKLGYFFLGSTDSTLRKIEERLKNEYPGIKRKGFYAPPFGQWGEEEDERIIRAVNGAGADILWVGLTAPRQEIWLHAHKEKLAVKMAAAIGAGFDFFAGTRKRAPQWMQGAGLEWLYRVLQEPFRMGRRYAANAPAFVKWVWKGAFGKRRR